MHIYTHIHIIQASYNTYTKHLFHWCKYCRLSTNRGQYNTISIKNTHGWELVLVILWAHKDAHISPIRLNHGPSFLIFGEEGHREISRVYRIIIKHVMKAVMKISKINLDYKLTYWAVAWRTLPVLYKCFEISQSHRTFYIDWQWIP